MEMKYVRGRIGFAIFDAGQTHADIARAMHEKPISAGKCTIAIGYKNPGEYGLREESTKVSVHCYGRSSTLGLESKEEDGEYLEKQFSRYW